jgi:RNA polymerase sigma-70 factor (ECF subfamily)
LTHQPRDLTPEALRAESAALQRLAYGLLGDSHSAADAVQETWLSALTGQQNKIDANWLSVVTRNFARRVRRGEKRRERREQSVAKTEAQASTAEAVERMEIHQHVVQAVLTLEEPYRTTVILRYWEDLAPRKVAKRMEVPVATVHTRLRRAAEQLRGRLDSSFGDRAAWATPLAAWAAPQAAAGVLATTGMGLGLFAMKTKVAALCAVSLTLGWLLVDGSDSNATALPDPTVEVANSDREEGESPEGKAASAEGVERQLAALPTDSGDALTGSRIRVLDQHGNPAVGVQIHLASVSGQKPESWQLGESDADGLLAWPDSAPQLEDYLGANWKAYAQITGGPCAVTWFDPRKLGSDPLAIQLPPTGSLTVRVSDEDNSPLDGRYLAGQMSLLRLSPLPPALTRLGQSEISRSDLRGLAYTTRSNLDAQGTVHYPYVLLGKQLVVTCGVYEPVIYPGPKEPDAEEHIEYAIPNSSTLIGRLLDTDGKPLASALYQYLLRSSPAIVSSQAATDAQGYFRIKLGNSDGDYALRKAPWLFFRGAAVNQSHGGPSAGFQLGHDLSEGLNDLGDVRLAEPPLVLSCRFVTAGMDLPTGQSARIEAQVASGSKPWRLLSEVYCEDLGEGKFRFLGHVPDLPLRLSLNPGPWMPMAPIEFVHGQDDLEIELLAGGSLQATFLLDDGPWQNLDFSFTKEDARQSDPNIELLLSRMRGNLQRAYERGRPASIEWTGLVPGKYRFRAELPGSGKAIVDISDVLVPAGGRANDPALDAIDLRDLKTAKLRIHAADGQLLRDPRSGVLVETKTGEWFEINLEAGIARLPLHEPVNLWVFAPEHMSKPVESVLGDMQIDLEAAPRIQFEVSPVPVLPADVRMSIGVYDRRLGQVTPTSPGSERRAVTRALGRAPDFLQVTKDGKASMHLRFPREVDLNLRLHHADRMLRIPVKIAPIDLVPGKAQRNISLELDAEVLRAAVARILE